VKRMRSLGGGWIRSALRSDPIARLVALASSCALLLQAFLPFLSMPGQTGSAAAAPAWVLSTLCGASPTISDPASEPGAPPSRQAQSLCPVCFGWHLSGASTVLDTTVLVLPADFLQFVFRLTIPQIRCHITGDKLGRVPRLLAHDVTPPRHMRVKNHAGGRLFFAARCASWSGQPCPIVNQTAGHRRPA
jgi:hypothetical protein